MLDAAALAPVLAALGLDAADRDARCPAQVAGSGSTRLLIGLRSGARLATLRPDAAALARLSDELGIAGFFPFSLAPAVGDCTTEARMFCPAIGIDEDPVSGNAHGRRSGVYLVAHGLLAARDGRAAFPAGRAITWGAAGASGSRWRSRVALCRR
ncbi:MAG: PhzF family phenazine biosynthesis protein [Steroidobacteraceae bacterium]